MPQSGAQLVQLLEGHGYRRVPYDGEDGIMMHENYPRTTKLSGGRSIVRTYAFNERGSIA